MNKGENLTGHRSQEGVLGKEKYTSPVINAVSLSCDIITASDGVDWANKWGDVDQEWGTEGGNQ